MALTWQERRMNRAVLMLAEANAMLQEAEAQRDALNRQICNVRAYITRATSILDAPPPRTPGAMAPVTRIREAA